MKGPGITDRWKWAIPFAVIAVILMAFSMYQWIVPRTDLEVRTVYHEAPGGGGTGGLVNVNVLLTNKGNRDIEDLECLVRVINAEGSILVFKDVKGVLLQERDNAELKLVLVGSQYKDYRITIDLVFSSARKDYVRDLEYVTQEDAMNLVFVEDLP